MKILVLTNLYPPHAIGGYEERCRQVTDALRDRGHEVRVLTSTHGLAAPADEGRVHRRLRIHGFFGHPWLGIRRLYGLEAHNHAVLRAALADFAPDVVHVWNLGGLSKALMLTLQASGRPVVYDVSDHWIARSLRADVWLRWWNGEAGGAGARLLRGVLRATGLAALVRRRAPFAPWAGLRFDRIYFCSDALKQITVRAGWPVAHAAVIYCGVETARFARRPADPRCTRLLFVGRLNSDKDPLTAVRALARCAQAGRTDLTLDLYGRGDEAYVAELRAAAAAGGVADRVAFRTAPAAEMRRVYAGYDALLFTSAWEEPFALTPLEAMAARVPVISTYAGGSRELVRDGENALGFAAGDDAALAQQILRLAADPVLRVALADTAEREVVARYDLAAITSQIERALQEARP
ncbi:MAG: glycosyltransferase family 4 protein [Opitutaceae bacterium]|nr:glycosyltransferase family 4 protein [Opitutaceae bacterium]